VPVFIACEPTTLTRNERWYEVPYKRVHFSLTVGPECEPPTHGKAHGETDEETDGQSGVPTTILVRRQQDRLNAFFEHMLEVAAAQDKAGT
jgi:hypothetical protein